jgi:hypothetical protein
MLRGARVSLVVISVMAVGIAGLSSNNTFTPMQARRRCDLTIAGSPSTHYCAGARPVKAVGCVPNLEAISSFLCARHSKGESRTFKHLQKVCHIGPG